MKILIQNDHQSHGRLLSVSIFRVISMLMIILFHCMCYSAGFWEEYFHCAQPVVLVHDAAAMVVSLALPAFFFVSGFLYAYLYVEKDKYRNWKSFMVSKFKRLILPTITWTIIYLAVLPFRYPLSEVLTGIQHLWFLPVLFCVFMIVRLVTPWLLAVRKPLVDIVIASAVVIVNYLLFIGYQCIELDDSLLIGRILTYLDYFIVGIMMYKHRFALSNKLLEIILVVLLLGCHVACMNIFVTLAHGLVNTIVIIAICILVMDVLSVVSVDGHSIAYRILDSLDKNSMGIYLIHQVLIMVLYQYTSFDESFLTAHPYLAIVALFLSVLLVSWALSSLKRKLKLEPYL